MRYLGQSWELAVDVPAVVASIAALESAFAEVHDRRFGHKSGGAVEIVNFRVTAIGRVSKPELPPWRRPGPVEAARTENRPIYFEGRFQDTAVYDRDWLPAQAPIAGPAVIEESGATTIVPPGWRAVVLDRGDLLMERRP
ncbi:MAG: hypothetical protein FJX52_15565 [Alphaproteobacteria bacterium]|nr:hypothetical protein [Alphaproteobacteria bacterium]